MAVHICLCPGVDVSSVRRGRQKKTLTVITHKI